MDQAVPQAMLARYALHVTFCAQPLGSTALQPMETRSILFAGPDTTCVDAAVTVPALRDAIIELFETSDHAESYAIDAASLYVDPGNVSTQEPATLLSARLSWASLVADKSILKLYVRLDPLHAIPKKRRVVLSSQSPNALLPASVTAPTSSSSSASSSSSGLNPATNSANAVASFPLFMTMPLKDEIAIPFDSLTRSRVLPPSVVKVLEAAQLALAENVAADEELAHWCTPLVFASPLYPDRLFLPHVGLWFIIVSGGRKSYDVQRAKARFGGTGLRRKLKAVVREQSKADSAAQLQQQGQSNDR
jgi:hypothetical protein